VQRVSPREGNGGRASLGEIGPGLMILLGVGKEDTSQVAAAMAEKVANLRIFEDEQGKMNRSLLDVKGKRAGGFAVYFVRRRARTEAAELYCGGGAGACEGIIREFFGGASQAGNSLWARSFSGHDVRGAGE